VCEGLNTCRFQRGVPFRFLSGFGQKYWTRKSANGSGDRLGSPFGVASENLL
jgi:hypothetical protein